MNKVTRIKNANYTTISNVFLRDKELSLKAKGLLAIILSLPETWDFSIKGICATIKEGTTAVYSAIDELKERGYCKVATNRNEKGMIVGNDYTFYEDPNVENLNVDNQSQINTNISLPNTKDTNIKEINKEEKEIEDKSSKKDDEIDEFVEKIYKLYPTKCPIRGTSLSKSHADKKRIKALLKKYTKEQILMVVENEIKNKYGKYSLKNFSTFLNNFPDPSAICENSTPKQNTLFDNLPTGMIIRETLEERNEKFKNEKGW